MRRLQVRVNQRGCRTLSVSRCPWPNAAAASTCERSSSVKVRGRRGKYL